MKKQTVVFALLTVIWCAVIFTLSSENADNSTQTSGRVIKFICNTFVPDFEEKTSEEQQDLMDSMSFVVRKCAHFSAYAILGGLAFMTYCFIKRRRMRAACSLGTAFLYSVSDEIHQSFVPGRSCELRDVFIDTSGALLSILILLFVMHIVDKRKRRKEN